MISCASEQRDGSLKNGRFKILHYYLNMYITKENHSPNVWEVDCFILLCLGAVSFVIKPSFRSLDRKDLE